MDELIYRLNELIINEEISDKAISFTAKAPHLASWNMGCGSKWVNPKSAVGTAAAGGANPTWDAVNKQTGEGHAERMNCCVAVLNALKAHKIQTVAVQEAPSDTNDAFYQKAAAVSGDRKGNIRLAAVGAALVKSPDPVHARVQQLMQQSGVVPHELVLIKNQQGDYILDVHLDWSAPNSPNRKNRAQFLNAVLLSFPNQPFYIMGDSNLERLDLSLIPGAAIFGAPGCYTTDVVMNLNFPQSYLRSFWDAYTPSPSAVSSVSSANIELPPSGVEPVSSSSAVSSSSSSTSIFQKFKSMFGASATIEAKKEVPLIDTLKLEKDSLEMIISEHSYAVANIDLGDETEYYQNQLDQAKAKLPLVMFEVAYLEDFNAQYVQKQSHGMKEMIEDNLLTSIEDVAAYIKGHPKGASSRAAKVFNKLKDANYPGGSPFKEYNQSQSSAAPVLTSSSSPSSSKPRKF